MRYTAWLVVGLVLPGCTRDAGWSIQETRTASGAPLVVNVPPASGLEPTWRIEEEVRIGSIESGPAAFGTIKGLLVLADQRVVVLDAQAQELRIFGADGQHVHTWGRKGAGPGEFNNANGVLLGRDGLIRVNDPANARMSFVDPDTGFAGSVPLEVLMFGFLWQAVLDTADHVWEYGYAHRDGQRMSVLKGYDPQGRWTDTVPQPESSSSPGAQRGVYSYRRGNAGGMMIVPYWPRAVSTLDAQRARWSKTAHINDYRIVRTTLAGDTTLVLESRRPAAEVSRAERDSAIERARRVAGELDWSQIPNEKPIISQLFVAAEGDLWVRVNTAADSLTTFDVFAYDGRYKGTAVTPWRVAEFLPPVVRADRIWAVIQDELDVAHIVRGRLVTY